MPHPAAAHHAIDYHAECVPLGAPGGPDPLVERLRELGAGGWELVAALPTVLEPSRLNPQGVARAAVYCVLKRPSREQEQGRTT